MHWDWQFVTSIVQILIIDVVLSGDNAVVIALAAHRLPQQKRRIAILCGAAGAIVLRVLFTWILAQLLGIPLLRFGGGIVLIWIAMKLLRDEDDGGPEVRTAANLLHAVWIIVMADFVMSLDNMLAVGGASEGHATLIMFGLLLSIGIIMTCSAIIADWMNRFPILTVLGAAVLGWTAAEMMLEDAKIAEWVVTHQRICPDSSWHEDFGGEVKHLRSKLMGRHPEATPWWIENQDELVHRHWIGWALVITVVALVVAVPRALNKRSGAHKHLVSEPTGPPPATEPNSSNEPNPRAPPAGDDAAK